MLIKKQFLFLIFGFLLVILSACGGIGSIKLMDGDHQDNEISNLNEIGGEWTGLAQKTIGSARCNIDRLGLRFEIDRLVLVGLVKRKDRTHYITGELAEDGKIIKMIVGGSFDREALDLKGKFTTQAVEGKWQSADCAGSWRADRVK